MVLTTCIYITANDTQASYYTIELYSNTYFYCKQFIDKYIEAKLIVFTKFLSFFPVFFFM